MVSLIQTFSSYRRGHSSRALSMRIGSPTKKHALLDLLFFLGDGDALGFLDGGSTLGSADPGVRVPGDLLVLLPSALVGVRVLPFSVADGESKGNLGDLLRDFGSAIAEKGAPENPSLEEWGQKRRRKET